MPSAAKAAAGSSMAASQAVKRFMGIPCLKHPDGAVMKDARNPARV